MCVRARIIDQELMYLIRSIDSNMADLGLHITLLPISRQALPSSAATCQNQLLVLQIGLCLFLYVFPVFELLSVLFCSVLLCLARAVCQQPICNSGRKRRPYEPVGPLELATSVFGVRGSGLDTVRRSM